MGLVSGACQQLTNFKQKQQRRRLLSSNGCIGGGGATMTGAAAERSKHRESMLNVTKSAFSAVPVSTTLIGGVANTAAQVLSDPCEATSSARSAGVNLIAGLVNTAGSADNDVTLSAEGSANLLGALSAAVTPAEDGDENAAGASAAATGTARAMMMTQLGPALPGEKPASVNTPMMSYVASRVAPPTNDTGGTNNATGGAADAAPSAAAGGAAFAVPMEALALGGGAPVDQLLLAMAYDPHAGSKGNKKKNNNNTSISNSTGNGTAGAGNGTVVEKEDIASAPRMAGTVSLVLNAPGGGELKVRDLKVPIGFSLHLDNEGEALKTPVCYIDDVVRGVPVVSGINATPPRERVVCSFFDEDEEAYSSEGCATLPNPYPPGSEVKWTAGVKTGQTRLSIADESFLWTFTHPTLLNNCTLNETMSADNATRLRIYTGANCSVEDPMNPTRCYWRRSTQAFEGCGCFVAPAVQCLCNHATDFSASSSPPKIKPISIEELMSISLDDILATWKVFAVVGGMFACTMFLALIFEARDTRAKKKLLNKFINPAHSSSKRFGFAVVQDIWTWNIDVQEMQFMFNNLHHPNTQAEVNKVIGEQIGTDDEEAINRRLEEIVALQNDCAYPEIQRAIDRRRAAVRRAARAREGLPQVANGQEGVDPEVIKRLEAEIERSVAAADVGIKITKRDQGKSRFELDLMAVNVLKDEDLKKLKFKADEVTDSSNSEAEEADDAADAAAADGLKPPGSLWTQSIIGSIKRGGGRVKPLPSAALMSKFKDVSVRARSKASKAKITRGGNVFVIPPKRKHVKNIPFVKRNGPSFCAACGLNYIRFIVAFPLESLKRSLVLAKHPADKKGVHLAFDRAVGTAMVYAFLDVKNVVGHLEMASRIYDAAQLPWLMPTGITFPLLVAEFKAMLSGNLTAVGWMKRSNLWNIVALQKQDGSWAATDSLAGALKALAKDQAPETRPPMNNAAGGGRPVIKSYYEAETLLRCCPQSLMACSARLGWIAVDDIWCTLLAVEGCRQNGQAWVLNPWDNAFDEFDILQCGWTFIEQKIDGDPAVAAAVMDAEKHAEKEVTAWRENFVATVESLHALRKREEKEKKARDKAERPPLATRAWNVMPKSVGAVVGVIRRCIVELYKFIVWGVKLYMAAHMFFRAFLASPTDSFSGAERIVMQSTLYLVGLLVATWFYYIKSTECCALLRLEIGCSGNVLDACEYVPAGAGCAVFMSQKELKPKGWQCTAFPDKKNGYHFLTVIAIQLAIMFPVKLTLVKVFTAGGGTICEPHWRQAVVAAGMNMMEVYVAWMEVFFQLLSDPAGALQKPELQKILKASTGAIKKMLTVGLMHSVMGFFAVVFYTLDRLGLYSKKKEKQQRFEPVDVIRDKIKSTAYSDQTLAVSLGLSPRDDAAAVNAAKNGSGNISDSRFKSMSVSTRMLFTTARWSGRAAKLHADVQVASVVPGGGGGGGVDSGCGIGMAPASFYMTTLHARMIQKSHHRVMLTKSSKTLDYEPFGGGSTGREEDTNLSTRPARVSFAWGVGETRVQQQSFGEKTGGGGGADDAGRLGTHGGEHVIDGDGNGDSGNDNSSGNNDEQGNNNINDHADDHDGSNGNGKDTVDVDDEAAALLLDGEVWLKMAVANAAEDAAKLNYFLTSARGLPNATKLAVKMIASMDAAARDGGPPGYGGSSDETAHALALVRAAVCSAGGVSAAVAMIRLPEECGGYAAMARRGGEEATVASASAAAGTALLARLCVTDKKCLMEMRIDDGFDAMSRMLACDTPPRPTPRAVADACIVIVAAVHDSVRAARAAIQAGLVGVLQEYIGALSHDLYSKVSGFELLKSDRDYADQLAAVLAAFAELKSRERERDRANIIDNGDGGASASTTIEKTERFYLDITRLLPPTCDKEDQHVPAAAAAFAAMLSASRGTVMSAEMAMQRAGVMPALANLPLGTPGHNAAVVINEAFGDPNVVARLKHYKGAPRGTRLPPVTSGVVTAAGAAAAFTSSLVNKKKQQPPPTSISSGLASHAKSMTNGLMKEMNKVKNVIKNKVEDVKEFVEDAFETVGDYLEEAEEYVKDVVEDATDDMKTMLAVQTISISEILERRRQYVKKLKWSSVFNQNLGWFLTGFTWFFGAWVIITYGVLIYRFMGPGEESTYISNWGMAFVVNTFGIESLQIIGRKAFFIFIVGKFKKQFMKAQEALGWYEMYTEMAGMHLMVESGIYQEGEGVAENGEGEGDKDDGDDGGDGDGGD